ncbi:hypothetical protein IJ101_01590 [Candidatus Saccharibacteria bacterium]|nr:hypothetical protein [Candidatus Saccharibacteria bacterium]
MKFMHTISRKTASFIRFLLSFVASFLTDLNNDSAIIDFNSQSATVTVDTNNSISYTPTMSSNSTSLMQNDDTKTIPTLSPLDGGYSENDLTANRWGYRLMRPVFSFRIYAI